MSKLLPEIAKMLRKDTPDILEILKLMHLKLIDLDEDLDKSMGYSKRHSEDE